MPEMNLMNADDIIENRIDFDRKMFKFKTDPSANDIY